MPKSSPRRAPPARTWYLSPPVLIAAAFLIGLLLFVQLWWRDRDNAFYKAEIAPKTAEGQQFEPLPAPLPAGQAEDNNASGMREADEETANAPHIEAPRPPPPKPAAPPPQVALAPALAPVPIATPAPSYPSEALRRGESGTVLLRVEVGPDGVPAQVDVIQTSRSRSLDRAASDAVARWRFRPAQRDGKPVAGTVQVPIAFNPAR